MFGLARRSKTPPRRLGVGERVFAVGDIHGRNDLLNPLLAAMKAEAVGAATPVAVFLGDYVDRGVDSRGVVESLLNFRRTSGIQTRFLRGNHDDTLLKFLSDAAVGPTWVDFGGGETLTSYEVEMPGSRGDEAGWEAARLAFDDAIGDDHRAFFEELELFAEYGDYFFSHAGARPGVLLAEQSARDLMWIRDQFLTSKFSWPKAVVHGHTPSETPTVSQRRIGLDTGAYATGRLTCAILEDGGCRLLQAVASNGAVKIEGPYSTDLEVRATLR
jgi:serine/threonine protein phosphatase 1